MHDWTDAGLTSSDVEWTNSDASARQRVGETPLQRRKARVKALGSEYPSVAATWPTSIAERSSSWLAIAKRPSSTSSWKLVPTVDRRR